MVRRIVAWLAIAGFLWIEWRDVVAPLMAARHHAPGAPVGTLGLLLLPVAGILASPWLLLGGGLKALREDRHGERRPTWLTFTPEDGAPHAMAWGELASVGLAGGSKDFKPGSMKA